MSVDDFNRHSYDPARKFMSRDPGVSVAMSIRMRNSLVGIAIVAICGAIVFHRGYCSIKQVRPFYAAAVQQTDAATRRQFELQMGAFYSDVEGGGSWSALFTDDQINNWLASVIDNERAEFLPPDVREPRVAFSPGILKIGFRTHEVGVDTVVSVDADVFLTEGGEIAIQFREVHAGSLPLPARAIAEKVRKACDNWPVEIRWTQVEGRAVAVVSLDRTTVHEQRLFVDHLELDDGEFYIAGRTEAVDSPVYLEASRDPGDQRSRQ